jgi:hypothetical protein
MGDALELLLAFAGGTIVQHQDGAFPAGEKTASVREFHAGTARWSATGF